MNLQDRYEVAVVNRMQDDWELYKDVKFDTSDPQFQEWSNETRRNLCNEWRRAHDVQSFQHRGRASGSVLHGSVGTFKGYFPGYSASLSARS